MFLKTTGINGPKDAPITQIMDILFLQTLPTRSRAKGRSEYLIVVSIASSTRLRHLQENSEWISLAMRDGCTELTREIFNIVNQSNSTRQISGKM